MTDHDLRSLLRDQVSDVTTTADLSAGVWHTSRGARRRRTLGVVAGAAAATLLVVGGIAVLGNQSNEDPDPAPPSPSPVVDTRPDAEFRGAPVYWSPSLQEEAGLPLMTEDRPPLPEVIDLSADATPVEDDPIDHAVAAFGVVDDASVVRLLLLAPDGTYRTLDLSDVGSDPTISCCQRPPVRETMLSPTGKYLLFPQIDSVLIYDIPGDEWRRIDAGSHDTTYARWGNEREVFLPTQAYGGAGPTFGVVSRKLNGRVAGDPSLPLVVPKPSDRYGPFRNSNAGVLQAWGSGARVLVPTGTPSRPEMLLVTELEDTILTITGSPGGDDRWLQCCPVVGWAAENVAIYESRSGTPRIIGWTVGTHTFETVSTITGFTPGEQYYVGSYADFSE